MLRPELSKVIGDRTLVITAACQEQDGRWWGLAHAQFGNKYLCFDLDLNKDGTVLLCAVRGTVRNEIVEQVVNWVIDNQSEVIPHLKLVAGL